MRRLDGMVPARGRLVKQATVLLARLARRCALRPGRPTWGTHSRLALAVLGNVEEVEDVHQTKGDYQVGLGLNPVY